MCIWLFHLPGWLDMRFPKLLSAFPPLFQRASRRRRLKKAWVSIVTGLLAVALGGGPAQKNGLKLWLQTLKGREKVDANPIVAKMMSYGSKTKWAYAQEPIYPFAAHLPMPAGTRAMSP